MVELLELLSVVESLEFQFLVVGLLEVELWAFQLSELE